MANPILKDAVQKAISVREFEAPRELDLWPVFRKALDSTLEYLEIELANPDLDESRLCARIASKLPRRSVRRMAGEFRSALRSFDNPLTGFAWAIRRKEAWAGAANLRMIQGLGGTEAAESLSRTSVCLSRFSGTEVALNEAPDPIAKFRSAYWIGLRRLYPSMEKNDAFVRHAGDGFSD